jgi:hypothetical protein
MRFHLEAASAYAEEAGNRHAQKLIEATIRAIEEPAAEPRPH